MRSSTCLPRRSTHWNCRVVITVITLFFGTQLHAQPSITVEAVEVTRRPLVEEVPLSGSTYSPQIARLSAQVEGLVRQVNVDAGDYVEAGAVLLEMDTELTRIDRDQAAAQRESAAAARDDLARRLSDARVLAESNNIAASDVRTLETQASASAAEFRAADARFRRIEAELVRHQIKAPFAGTISERFAAPGEWVTPGEAVFEVVDSENLSLDFQVPQRYYPRVNANAELLVQFDAYPNQDFVARIHRKVPLSSPGARTFLLRGMISEGDKPALIPGMSASASLRVDADRTALAVPRDALVRYPDGRVSVWIVEDAAWGATAPVREQRVRLGLSVAGWVEITSGLQDGQVVITLGNESLQDGQSVTVQQAGGESR